jgi:hypothetical protein
LIYRLHNFITAEDGLAGKRMKGKKGLEKRNFTERMKDTGLQKVRLNAKAGQPQPFDE